MNNKTKKIITIIDYIEEHLTEKMNLEDIATAIGYSKYYLHRLFTNTVGISIHDYVQRRQLTEAGKLLVFSKKPIVEIALMAGYDSQPAFTNVFKLMYKKSPNDFRENKEFYPLQLPFNLKESIIPTEPLKETEQDIVFATMDDIFLWMELVHLIVDGYPKLNSDQYLETLKTYIIEKRALLLKNESMAIAIMLINYDTGSIDFFGIHPFYRKTNITEIFLTKIFKEFLKNDTISITTFRQGDKADIGYLKTYKKLGFVEAELLIEFGYPTQKLVYTPLQGENNDK